MSIVIPAYNEGKRISDTLDTIIYYLRSKSYTWEILVVDDGSTDNTMDLLREYTRSEHRVRCIGIKHIGKGGAVRHGILESYGCYLFMCDADLSMPIETIQLFLDKISAGIDIVIGSREAAGSRRFNESSKRHIRGRVFNQLVRFLTGINIQDTQCGFKCFNKARTIRLFEKLKTNGWAFDVEILYKALNSDITVHELPIDWHHNTDSKVRNLQDSIRMLIVVVLIRLRKYNA